MIERQVVAAKVFRSKVTPGGNERKGEKLTVVAGWLVLDAELSRPMGHTARAH